ncbi:hypothetical protein [Streptomyces violascens]
MISGQDQELVASYPTCPKRPRKLGVPSDDLSAPGDDQVAGVLAIDRVDA